MLESVAAGELSPGQAASQLAPLLVSGGAQAEDVGGFAKIDHDRRRRVGFPEVVFGDGKSATQIIDILTAMIRESDGGAGGEGDGDRASPIVATRVSPEKWSLISRGLPGQLTYHSDARIVSFGAPPAALEGSAAAAAAGRAQARGGVASIGRVAVLSAGTSDLAIAEEAAVLAELSGAEVGRMASVSPSLYLSRVSSLSCAETVAPVLQRPIKRVFFFFAVKLRSYATPEKKLAHRGIQLLVHNSRCSADPQFGNGEDTVSCIVYSWRKFQTDWCMLQLCARRQRCGSDQHQERFFYENRRQTK